MGDVKLFCEEYGALAGGADNLRKIYEYAVNDRQFSFLWCNFRHPDPRKVFSLRFERYLTIEDLGEHINEAHPPRQRRPGSRLGEELRGAASLPHHGASGRERDLRPE